MKKIILLLIAFVCFAANPMAQNLRQKDGNTVEALKIGYFTKKLDLTPDEAQKFWPVYNQYIAEVRQVRQQNRDLDEISIEEKIIAVRKKYKTEFEKALPAEKVNSFFKAEKDFNLVLRKELQDRNEKRQKGVER